MEWNFEDDSPVEEKVVDAKNYIAHKGIAHDKYDLRVKPGEIVPSEFLEDEEVLQWLLTKRAIKEV
jgi:hypothetical protein